MKDSKPVVGQKRSHLHSSGKSTQNMVRWLSNPDEGRVANAVAKAEQRTSAEIKVVIIRYCWGSLLDKAQSLFRKQKLHQLPARNAVLLLVVLANQEFLVFGDRETYQQLPAEFWLDLRDAMQREFRQGNVTTAIEMGLGVLGDKLAELFPVGEGTNNQVSDCIEYEE